ncbi:hypothetical protein JQ035_17285 [Clostridium botulinum]|nr:hypothetical protein [Clostridium botulinum]
MNKKVLSLIIMLNLILSIGSNVLAAPSIKESNELKETREQKNKYSKELKNGQ